MARRQPLLLQRERSLFGALNLPEATASEQIPAVIEQKAQLLACVRVCRLIGSAHDWQFHCNAARDHICIFDHCKVTCYSLAPTVTRCSRVRKNNRPSEIAGVAMQVSPIELVASN